MFLNFKKQPTLAQLIPRNYCDIHSHLLPSIDDGAQNVAESQALLSEVKKLGFYKVITTPHTLPGLWNNTPETITGAYEVLQHEHPELCSELSVGYASEYLLAESMISCAEENSLLCLKDRYLLIEMSFLSPHIGVFDLIFTLKQQGYVPVLAHPERYLYYHNHFNMYENLKNAGCYFQVNLLSTVGYYGPSVTNMAQKLLAAGMVDFVGSDIHKMRHIAAFQQKIKIKAQPALEQAFQANRLFL